MPWLEWLGYGIVVAVFVFAGALAIAAGALAKRADRNGDRK